MIFLLQWCFTIPSTPQIVSASLKRQYLTTSSTLICECAVAEFCRDQSFTNFWNAISFFLHLGSSDNPLSFIFHKAFISPDCATCLPQWAWAGTLFCTARMFLRSIYGVGSAENIVRLNKTRFDLAPGFERWLNRLIAPSREHENCLCAPNSHLKTTWSAMF